MPKSKLSGMMLTRLAVPPLGYGRGSAALESYFVILFDAKDCASQTIAHDKMRLR